MFHLRYGRPGDEVQVFRIVTSVLAEYGLSTDIETTDSDLKDIKSSYLSRGGIFKVIERDGETIGSYGLYSTTAQSCELRKMYLLPEFRGAGLGQQMMDDAFREARAQGFREMTLETNARAIEAMRLYQRNGFERSTPVHLSVRCDVAMKRSL